jgi:shikimate kinase
VPFVDLDVYIEEKAGLSVKLFLNMEKSNLERWSMKLSVELLSALGIIGLGGGTHYANNHELLNGECTVCISKSIY